MKVGELIIENLGLTVPKPKAEVCQLVELLFHSVAKGSNLEDTLELIQQEMKVQTSLTAPVMEKVVQDLDLVKLSDNIPATTLYLSILPHITMFREGTGDYTSIECTIEALREIFGYTEQASSTLKSTVQKAVQGINDVLKEFVFIRYDRKTSQYVIYVFNNIGLGGFRYILARERVNSLAEIDKYSAMWELKYANV